ncbi:MAG: hypothetical protein ACYCSS_13520 [Sulfuriferula sp.]
MSTKTTLSKGQIIIPATAGNTLEFHPRDKMAFVVTDREQFATVAATLAATTLKGLIHKPKIPVSIEQMNLVIAKRCVMTKC